MYTPFGGMAFLMAYFACRREAITSLRNMSLDKFQATKIQPDCQTHLKLIEIQYKLEQGECDSALAILEHYIRRFEVAKRLRNSYPLKDSSDLAPLETHILFYDVLIKAYWHRQDIRFINVMLKVGDTLISVLDTLDTAENVKNFVLLLEQELEIIEALMDKLKVTK